jgi:hypothetical protein
MNLFAESDRGKLVAPPSLFDREALREEHGDWGHQLLRAATAMEILAQITDRDLTVLLKGGTLLQHSLEWPPYRASIDLDLEVTDASALEAVLRQIEDAFTDSDVHVSIQDTPLSGFTGRVGFPRSSGPDWSLRIDALENDRWPAGTSSWEAIPAPWADATRPQVAPVETRASQKLLLSADPPYGRDLADHHGRQNFVKDLFDLYCLGEKPLESERILDAAHDDVERKSDYLDEQFRLEDLLDEGTESLRQVAHPPVDDDSLRGSIWRGYDRVKSGIRVSFTRASLRISAGCAHYALEGMRRDELDWQDTWRPATDRSPRSAWEGRPIQPVIEVEDDYGVTAGILEAWAQFREPEEDR